MKRLESEKRANCREDYKKARPPNGLIFFFGESLVVEYEDFTRYDRDGNSAPIKFQEELLIQISWHLNFLVKRLLFRLHWFAVDDTET